MSNKNRNIHKQIVKIDMQDDVIRFVDYSHVVTSFKIDEIEDITILCHDRRRINIINEYNSLIETKTDLEISKIKYACLTQLELKLEDRDSFNCDFGVFNVNKIIVNTEDVEHVFVM